jgi:hypothetical protein
MSFIAISTNNPLGQRPLTLMSRPQGMGWLGLGWLGAVSAGGGMGDAANPTPGDYDNNQQVLGELVAMGAISQDDANNIWAGTASLDDMAVNMTMINQALQLTGQSGVATPAPLPGAISSGGVDSSSESSWNAALNYLQEWNAALKEVSAIAMQHPNDPAWRTLDANLLNSQNQYNSTSNQFNTIYRAVYGHVAPGLSGGILGWLGQFDPATAAIYAAVLTSVTVLAYAGYQYSLSLKTQAQALLQQSQTAGAVTNAAIAQANALRQQAATALAQGNTALAAQLNAQADALIARATTMATTPPGSQPQGTNWAAWIQQNMAMVAIVILGITLGPPLIKKVF